MEQKAREMQCALCGHTSAGKFVGDICPDCGLTYWKCHNCGYTITAPAPPEVCPECHEKCDFFNITCYTPRMWRSEPYRSPAVTLALCTPWFGLWD
jgi:rubrerythrin